MSINLPPSSLSKVNEAVDDFIAKHGDKNLQPGTPEWNAAVDKAVQDYQLDQHRGAFAAQLELELGKKRDNCIRDGHPEKCEEGPWYGVGCSLCGKKGKLGAKDRNAPTTR